MSETMEYGKAWTAELRGIAPATMLARVQACRCILCDGPAASDNWCALCDEEFAE